MKRFLGALIPAVLLIACTLPGSAAFGGTEMKTLHIRWARLVDAKGRTCDRCGTTETAVVEAVKSLKRSLGALDIDVVLEKTALGESAFSTDPLQSNRIWIDERPIEEWLGASVGKSRCCSTCGDADCRTLTVDGRTYEAIPAALIVKAGLLAGARLVDSAGGSPCCPPAESSTGRVPSCKGCP